MTYSVTLHTNTIYSFTFPCKHDILIYFPMKKRYTHLLSHANTTCSFILTYKHDIHVLIYSPMQTQYTHSIQPFMLSRTSTPTTIQLFMLSRATKNSPPPTNTHYYPAIHVEPDHQAPTTIQLFMLSWHTFTIFLIRLVMYCTCLIVSHN